MKYSKLFLTLIVTCGCLFSCNQSNKKSDFTYQIKFVKGFTNNKIEVLDFGGSGQAILFLTGLGNSAHVFVDFAPKFTDKFHVYAMTRRGFGASDQTVNGYGIDTLSKDIFAVVKALDLIKIILIGHSIAGDEISKFASSYPGKADKIIYMDAAYDRMTMNDTSLPAPAFPNLTTKDSSSVENLNAFVLKVTGVMMPDEELKNTELFSKDGKFVKHVSPDSIQGLIMRGIEHPDYKDISCPALAIYAVHKSVKEIFPFYDSLNDIDKKKADTAFIILAKWQREQREVFTNEVKNGTAKEIHGADHYIFISNPDETEKLIREFLK